MEAISDQSIEAAILAMVRERGLVSTACPSEVARTLAPDGWRPLMQRVRDVAGNLAAHGQLEIVQKGRAVSTNGPWKGPIRLRLPRVKTRPQQPGLT